MNYKPFLGQMTLEEKIVLLSGKDFWQTQDIPRLGIPSMFLADGPHGMRRQTADSDHLGLNPSLPSTCFPAAATVSNSWNERLIETMGNYLGKEAVVQRVHVLLGPSINIKRNPLAGRNFEYYSEDPFLAGKLAAAYIRGIQETGIDACVKHFAANNQETNRMTSNSVVDMRTLRELYLSAFEYAVKEGDVRFVMSSYNKLNGIYTNENRWLLDDVLRKEWGFSGCVVTDWGGCNNRVDALIAGNDLEMPGTGGESGLEVLEAVISGRLREEVVNQAASRILASIERTNTVIEAAPDSFDVSEHHLFAREVAEESIVLLKNDTGILPLDAGRKVAVIGDFASIPRYQGAGSSLVMPTKLATPLEWLQLSQLDVVGFEPGFKRFGKSSASLLSKACRLAYKADVILLYLGLDESTEAEGIDRNHMRLPDNQISLLHELSFLGKDIIVVLSCGSVIEMPWTDIPKAIIHGYLGGQAGAEAMVRVITGIVNPSGKLAETYPITYESIPSSIDFPGDERTVEYREGLFVGYRYFDYHPEQIRFPFGYGLSYTTFEYTGLKIFDTGVSFTVRNTGSYPGKEIAQLYIGKRSQSIYRPVKELKGFIKIFLEPGKSTQVSIKFDHTAFRFFNTEIDKWDIEQGSYQIMIGASSRDIRLCASIDIKGTSYQDTGVAAVLPSYFSGTVMQVTDEEFKHLLGKDIPPRLWDRKLPLEYNDLIKQMAYARSPIARGIYHGLRGSRWFMIKIGKYDKANLIVMSFFNMPFRGIVKMMGGAVSQQMVEALLVIVNGNFFRGVKQFRKATILTRKRLKTYRRQIAAEGGK